MTAPLSPEIRSGERLSTPPDASTLDNRYAPPDLPAGLRPIEGSAMRLAQSEQPTPATEKLAQPRERVLRRLGNRALAAFRLVRPAGGT